MGDTVDKVDKCTTNCLTIQNKNQTYYVSTLRANDVDKSRICVYNCDGETPCSVNCREIGCKDIDTYIKKSDSSSSKNDELSQSNTYTSTRDPNLQSPSQYNTS